jgi:plasmid stabilization system protein ParE
MRRVVISATAQRCFQDLLEQGAERFGARVAAEKSHLVVRTLEQHLALYPTTGIYEAWHDCYAYPVSKTPFTIVYRFDDDELRILFIVHRHADRQQLNPSDVEW